MCHRNKRCAPDCSAAIRTLRGWRLVQPIRLSDRAAYGGLVADSTCQDRIAADKVRLLFEHSGGDSWSRSLAARIAFVSAVAIICTIALYCFLKTEMGLALRAVGASQSMARAQGLSTSYYVVLGIGIAGALSALGGSILAQNQSFADVNMGFGVLVNGLASLIVGEQLIGRQTLARQLTAPLVGAVVYYQVVSFALALGMQPSDLKLLTGLFVLALLGLPLLRSRRTPSDALA